MTEFCVFCAIIDGKLPAEKIHEDDHTLAFMDIYPLRPGHVLVVPKRHAQYVGELTAEERAHLFEAGNTVAQAIRASSLQPAALHFNINDGKAAHQTVPHVHLHLLPRYTGDVFNFVGTLLAKPVQMITGPVKPEKLARQAASIRQHLNDSTTKGIS